MYQKKEVRTGIRFLIGPCPVLFAIGCLVYYLLCLEIDVLSKYLAMLSTQA